MSEGSEIESESNATTSTFTGDDGVAVALHAWVPFGDPKAVVVVAHGLAEHATRYGELADTFVDAGYAMYASDHRGHGATASDVAKLGDTGVDGWNATLRDLARVTAIARDAHPGKPLFFFGHSMGSILAQRFVQLHGAELAGAIFCGSFGSIDHLDAVLEMADAAASGTAAHAPSTLQPQMFAGFNAGFAPKTGFEWLSRDEAEVRKYVDDPYCGFLLTNGSMATMLHGFADAWRAENEALVPLDLPILVIAGAADPAGAATGNLAALVDRYRARGVRDLTFTLYPDDRHEILNELDRATVLRDLLGWLDARVPA